MLRQKRRSTVPVGTEPFANIDEAVAVAADLLKAKQFVDVKRIARHILKSEPESVPALNLLGVALHHQGRTSDGIAALQRAVAIDSRFPPAHNNLGNLLRASRRFDEAVECYRRALAIDPDYFDSHMNLGIVLKTLDRRDEAIAAVQRAIATAPEPMGFLYGNLGQLLRQAGRMDEARAVYDEWLRVEPDSSEAQHLAAACTGEAVPDRASDDYVRRLFNAFAESFDRCLGDLEYQAPERIAEMVGREYGMPAGTLDVLDAGCGTGLCGGLLRPFARTLVGADLSAGMIRKSRERSVYDELVETELTQFLRQRNGCFDLIAAADVLIYFGRLDEVTIAAAGALRAGGRLVFSLERAEASDAPQGFRLNHHGRYSHAEDYVRSCLMNAGLDCRLIERTELRKETKQPVEGIIVLGTKPAARRPAECSAT